MFGKSLKKTLIVLFNEKIIRNLFGKFMEILPAMPGYIDFNSEKYIVWLIDILSFFIYILYHAVSYFIFEKIV